MKKKIDDLKQEYLKLSKDLEQEIIIIDDEIEENLKDFLESQIYIKGTEKKISNHY